MAVPYSCTQVKEVQSFTYNYALFNDHVLELEETP